MTNHTYPKYNAAGERERNAVGARIAEARNAKNWNLGKLTEGLKACGVNLTKAAVNKWETGETVPNIYQFLAVTALLGMDDRLGSYREDASHSGEIAGNGLGLAIARSIVEAHHGRIHAESTPGESATFIVQLPG